MHSRTLQTVGECFPCPQEGELPRDRRRIRIKIRSIGSQSRQAGWEEGETGEPERGGPASEVRLITLDPGHFHAALVQKEMYAAVARRVHVYAPLGPDLIAHLSRITGFNTRRQSPTAWQMEVHTGPDGPARLLRE